MHPHFIIFDCSLLLNPKQAGYSPPPHAELGLKGDPAEAKINDMSYISLFRYVFTKPFVCI